MPFGRCFLFSLALFLFIGGKAQHYCIAGRFSETPLYAPEDLVVDSGVTYGNAYNPFTHQMEALRMDIYYPDTKKDTMRSRPVIISVHGGGFLIGTRSLNNTIVREFARRGYVVANIDYRLGWNCTGSICKDCVEDTAALRQAAYMAVQDLHAAARFIAANAPGLHANPDAVFLSGSSAGAMTALMCASYGQQEMNRFAPGAEQLLGLIDTSGNAFRTGWKPVGLMSFCGALPGDTSMLAYLNLPLISFHDQDDCLVPYGLGRIFTCGCDAFFPTIGPGYSYPYMIGHGKCAELHTMPGSQTHCSFPDIDVVRGSACFFKRVLCGACGSDSAYGAPVNGSCDSLQSYFSIGTKKVIVSVQGSPANHSLSLEFSDYSHSGGSVVCRNMLGQEFLRKDFPALSTGFHLDVREIPSGIYILSFYSAETVAPVSFLVSLP